MRRRGRPSEVPPGNQGDGAWALATSDAVHPDLCRWGGGDGEHGWALGALLDSHASKEIAFLFGVTERVNLDIGPQGHRGRQPFVRASRMGSGERELSFEQTPLDQNVGPPPRLRRGGRCRRRRCARCFEQIHDPRRAKAARAASIDCRACALQSGPAPWLPADKRVSTSALPMTRYPRAVRSADKRSASTKGEGEPGASRASMASRSAAAEPVNSPKAVARQLAKGRERTLPE